MKHYFIINPAAGKGNTSALLESRIRKEADRLGMEYSVILTTLPGQASEVVREAASQTDDICRFYACGGDGTLNEVLNGIVGLPNAECALLPAGTGNDFSRNFSNPENFLDVEKQYRGHAERIDILRCNDRYSLNMVNIGFDCDVVARANSVKKKTPIGGSLAYIIGVFITLAHQYGRKMTITFPDGEVRTGDVLLAAVGNGGYCGGGFHSHPEVFLDDGYFDLCLVKKVSRPTFLSLLVSYRKGTHLKATAGKDIIDYRKFKSLSLKFDEEIGLCYDGEVIYADHADFTILENAISFIVPEGSELIPTVKKAK